MPLENIGTLKPDFVVYTVPGDARSLPGVTPSVIPGLTGDLLGGAVVLEAEYKHPSLSNAPCRRYISGKMWCLHQALAGYGIFTGEAPNLEALTRVISTC